MLENLGNAVKNCQINQSSHINGESDKANFPKESLGRCINIRPHFSMTDQDNVGRHTYICTHTNYRNVKGDKTRAVPDFQKSKKN